MKTTNPFIKGKQAADILGISRETLRLNYAKYGIRRADYETHFRYHIDDCHLFVAKKNRPTPIAVNNNEYLRKRLERIARGGR